MAKIKLTKNELKKQKDELKMFERYLPTLVLKKQQLQSEIRQKEAEVRALREEKEALEVDFRSWIAVFGEEGLFSPELLRVDSLEIEKGNIAGVEIPVFKDAILSIGEIDFYSIPPWVDAAAIKLQAIMRLDLEVSVLNTQIQALSRELRVTSQRVNLFEKVKIPEAEANIKKIQIYLGDEQTAAVVRGKIAKRGMESVAQ